MHVLYTLWFGYAWPSLKGNGPEALIQTVAYAAIAIAIYPPLRGWVVREAHRGEAELHRKLDHIIKYHPGIPDFPPTPPAK